MSAVVSSVALAALASLAACGPRDPIGPVGVSTPSPPPVVQPKGPMPPALPSTIPADFRTRLAKLNRARFVSQGHLVDRFWVDVYANEAGKATYDGTVPRAAVGALLVKESFEHRVEGEVEGPIFMMEKRDVGFDPEHGDWRYVVVNAKGEIAGDGKLHACALCHDDAPQDHVFHAAQ